MKDKETGVYKIYDFKTSSIHWNDGMKNDQSKIAQLLLYKSFYSNVFNVPLNMIEVEFFILKRKLFEGVSYPQSRIQIYSPSDNKKDILETVKDFIEFVDTCFKETGEYNKEANYFKNTGLRKKHCKYCPHHKTKYCDGKEEKN